MSVRYLRAGERDRRRAVVGERAGLLEVVGDAGDAEDAAAVRDQPVAVARGARCGRRARRAARPPRCRRSASPVSLRSGYSPPATTTVTAARGARLEVDPARSPAAAPASAPSRSPSSQRRSDCVSGSPNRQLNSSTFGPSAVSISPAKSTPVNGAPRRASSLEHGRVDPVDELGDLVDAEPGTGENDPMPPVFGPVSPSPTRL